jgi:hypothetical protein
LSNAFAPSWVEGMRERVLTEGGRGRCRPHSQRWGSRAMSDACAPSRAVPNESTTTGSCPPLGEARRTWGVSPMVNVRPPHPRVERAAGLQSQRSKIEEIRGKRRRSQVHCARHAFTSQLTLAVRRHNLEYGASAVFPCSVIPATDPQGRAPALGRLTNYGSRVI